MNISIFLAIYITLNIIIISFQICLSLGVPWGSASMGGKFKGSYPKDKRIIPIISIVVLLILSVIVLIRVGFIYHDLLPMAKVFIWVVALYYAIGTILNIITPSKIERIWAPVAGMQLICIIVIALS